MKHFNILTIFLAVAAAPLAFGQRWEIGAAAGGSFYTSQTFTNPAGDATGGLANGFAVSGWLANNTGNVIGGELRYDYEHSALQLSSNSTNVSFGGQTNSVHYDVLMHFAPSESHLRPFIAAGAGVKLYSGTGKEEAYQPLSEIALLTKTNQVEPVVSVGGGLKFALTQSTLLRMEVHDYLTPFPQNVIAPNVGSKVGGWLSDFVVSAGVSFGL